MKMKKQDRIKVRKALFVKKNLKKGLEIGLIIDLKRS
jgi:hypothetical protein